MSKPQLTLLLCNKLVVQRCFFFHVLLPRSHVTNGHIICNQVIVKVDEIDLQNDRVICKVLAQLEDKATP